jgi:type I restriction enzyme S subunit
MRQYKPYPANKESGVEWIGNVPEDWDVFRLRHVADFSNSNVDKKSYDDQEPVALCNYTDVYYREFITSDMPFMEATASHAEKERFQLKKGDVLVTKDSEDPSDIGIPAFVAEDLPGVVCGYHLTMIRSSNLATSRLLHRIFQSHPTKAYFFVEAPGITRFGLGQDTIGNLRVCLPAPEHRERIADCIDRETSRIDSLITKKTRFVEILKEKRQSVIYHAVTRGLQQEVAMVDTGNEWLKEIPSHWSIRRANWLFWERNERSENGDETLLSLRMEKGLVPHSEVSEKEIEAESLAGYKLAFRGDVVVNKMRASIGLVSLTYQEGIVSPDYSVFVPLEKTCSEYYAFLFKTSLFGSIFRAHSTGLGTGSSGFLRLYSEAFFSLWLPYPSHEEQLEIVRYISTETNRIDQLIEKTQRSIDLLKERRSAFITAAVTGQIDLRGAA